MGKKGMLTVDKKKLVTVAEDLAAIDKKIADARELGKKIGRLESFEAGIMMWAREKPDRGCGFSPLSRDLMLSLIRDELARLGAPSKHADLKAGEWRAVVKTWTDTDA